MCIKYKYRVWHHGIIRYHFVTTKRNLEDCIELMKERFKDYRSWFLCLVEGDKNIIVYDTRIVYAPKVMQMRVDAPKEIKPSKKELSGLFDEENFFKNYKY